MNHHTPTAPSWPWPNDEEKGRLWEILDDAETQITEHQRPEMIHVEHPDGRSLWATYLDAPLEEDLQFTPHVFRSSLSLPVVETSQEALKKRITALRRDARVYNMHPQPRSPMRKNPHIDAGIRDLEERITKLSKRWHVE